MPRGRTSPLSKRTEQEDLAYDGNVTELVEEDGDVLDAGSTWQSWTFKLAGKFTAAIWTPELLLVSPQILR